MSESASGTFGKVLTFSKRKSGQQVRFQKKQKDVISENRTLQRDKYLLAVGAWNGLTPAEKSQWTKQAKGQALTGYNLFLSIYLNTQVNDNDLAIYGLAIFGNTIYGDI